ncbi:hypothetical protein DB31_1741 [Hyalangium minutum]|uniref:Uncharacterized protein n=1 Tax=Hyalangium minutum TaxID=394096 RepID=A0A085WAL0_9BACT|nr:hypothetical protein DB31_1741 [Hyalangium minutum]
MDTPWTWKKLDAAGAALFGLLLGLTGLVVAILRLSGLTG